MKLISWNVNGIRAVMKKEFIESLNSMAPDILCLQETKAQDNQVVEALKDIDGFHIYINSAVKKGYSGTAILSKKEPLGVTYGIGIEEHDQEGRVITAEYKEFYLVNAYVPNSQNELKRLDYRAQWDKDILTFLQKLDTKKPVVFCGDLNVAHTDKDIKNAKSNYNKSAGYTQTEIDGLSAFIECGFVDTWRYFNPDEIKYSWWSYRFNSRAKNTGWRIDYFLTSRRLLEVISDTEIHNDVYGSDHCPVSININF
ncbi:MAG: exodeoxyribonuclease III [Flavobacteriales bacterium]|nr:exodeoxyribonuclease III [Flavobacteriales bacterium]|tara:strand:+ start:2539 stop:3303 length:765 start_codon:yes stop_codon:yes gene_type:complete